VVLITYHGILSEKAAATEDEDIADGLGIPLQTSLRLLLASFYFAEERTVPRYLLLEIT